MLNFYGGQTGDSFEIKAIFSSRWGETNSLQADINLGWQSPVPVGAFVVISYGFPFDESYYDEYYNIDREKDGLNYNSTLWQKVYNEKQGVKGINYQLIMSMTGATPRVTFKPVVEIDADQAPYAEYDVSNADRPVITLYLPQSQILHLFETVVLNANEPPVVIYDDTGEVLEGANINDPKIQFQLPQAQVIGLGSITILKANEQPRVEVDSEDINHPKLNFFLPVSQLLQQGVTTVLHANEEPSFSIDSSDPDKPVLSFSLPRSQVMQQATLEVLDSTQSPQVSLNSSDIDKPFLEFQLPRSVRFFFGDELGKRIDKIYNLTKREDYGVGDYYINSATGFIYQIIAVNEADCTVEYRACIQQPLPDVATSSITPYTEDLQQNNPKVVKSYTNDEQTTWQLEFQLPQIPVPEIEASFIGATEEPSAQVAVTSSNAITFSFSIPTGSRIFSGVEIDEDKLQTVIADAQPGDVYINTDRGRLFELALDGAWEPREGTIKGPVGEALYVYDTFESAGPNSLETGVELITLKYPDMEYKAEMLFAVTFKDGIEDLSYWYFKSYKRDWDRVQLTRSVAELIVNSYTPDASKQTYSADYLNQLIGDDNPTAEGLDESNTAYSKEQINQLLTWGTWDA